jgi:hypothetical protein
VETKHDTARTWQGSAYRCLIGPFKSFIVDFGWEFLESSGEDMMRKASSKLDRVRI